MIVLLDTIIIVIFICQRAIKINRTNIEKKYHDDGLPEKQETLITAGCP